MNKRELIQQTRTAFDFLQKLYLETSYLIKEIEGMLVEEEEKFFIGRPRGYGITRLSSSGLEASNVNYWPIRMFSVFFVPESFTKLSRGASTTMFFDSLKIIYLRIVLDEKDITEPYIKIGVLYKIEKKRKEKWPEKFEDLISHIETNHTRIFTKDDSFQYEDSYTKFKGNFIRVNLFDLKTSEEIINLVTVPTLKLYRSI